MSDGTAHFGSIQELERISTSRRQEEAQGINFENLQEAPVVDHAMDVDQQAYMKDLQSRKVSRNLALPADDKKVREHLRARGEPITLFGEGPYERRERLRNIMMKGDYVVFEEEESDDSEEEFFTVGSQSLLDARRWIARYSLDRARSRLNLQKEDVQIPIGQRKKWRHELYRKLETTTIFASQTGDERPLGYVAFSPNSKMLATCGWGSQVKIWNVPACESLTVLKGHCDRVSGLAWHPSFGTKHTNLDMASGGADGSICLWNVQQSEPLSMLEGHQQRVARLGWHPSGRFLVSTSFDETWRLWDAETATELLVQEGHGKQVYALGIHPDGSLVGTGGYDCHAHLWDLRSGRSLMVLQGHVKPILALDWHSNGYEIVTGAEDNAIRVWDVRNKKCIYTLPGHTNLVSNIKIWKSGYGSSAWDSSKMAKLDDMDITMDNVISPEYTSPPENVSTEEALKLAHIDGCFMISSSYDGTCKIWTESDWKPIRSLSAHDGKVASCDVSPDARWIATAGHDRTFKIWAHDGSM